MERVLACGCKLGRTVGNQVGSAAGVTAQHNWGAKYVGVGIMPVLYSAFKEVVKAAKHK